MAVTIKFPTSMRGVIENQSSLEIEFEGKLLDLFKRVVREHSAMEPLLFENDVEIKSYLSVFKNDKDIRNLGGLNTAIDDGDEIFILSPIAGG